MRKILIPLLAFLISSPSIADEGMWLPHLLKTLNENEMQLKGLKITAEDIYSVNESSLKDAIVALNGGSCTAEMISSEGLMLTNHHCVDDLLQTHSTVENNFLEDGFWAMSKSEELKNENLSATFLISIEDVTNLFKDSLSIELSETERNKKISEISKKIVSEKTDSTSYSARVRSFYGGNDFYLITYVTYKDVRLVGAPPSSIGKFGGDTDNWMWPRHTGDFALLRIYMAEDGSPAEYSVDNIPYKPKHHLPIQLGGVENEEFTMIMGYPGRTNRYLTSFGVKEALEITYPEIIDIRTKKLEIMKSGMNSSKEIKLQYAAKYSSIANYWKYFIGQSKGLKSMRVYDKKVETENMLKLWIDSANTDIKEKYGNTMQMLEEAYEKNTKVALNRTYLTEAIFQGPEILSFSYTMKNRINALPKDKEAKSQAIRKLKKLAKEFYKNYNAKVDEDMLAAMLEMYYYNVPKYQHSKIFKKIENQLFGIKKLDFNYFAKNLFNRSYFSNEEKCLRLLKNPSKLLVEKDPAYITFSSIYNKYLEELYPIRKEVRDLQRKGNRLFISALREMDTIKKFYPDANSTMRVTYGNVRDYKPGEAMLYDYYTTINGVIEKEDPTNDEFIVPKKLKELYTAGDFGRYSDNDGNLRVNFISNNDITGGNSGSPVINAWGEIVGTAFDGNWEAMSGDIAFEKNIQRTISVDIRYILFVIDKYANASYLIDEMTLAPVRE
ncbi:MAG: S46 family peptidase [Flavobacteriales bacterium]